MITEIQMSSVASYKEPVSLKTEKKVNLIYGLNGTGKSIFSDFLYDPSDSRFAQCSMIPTLSNEIFVYNQSFIRDNFYEAGDLKGIFSLSKENKAAEEKISAARRDLDGLEQSRAVKQEEKKRVEEEFEGKTHLAVDEIWEIKTSYCGGDRVLEYCLDGLKGKKETLFAYLLSIAKPAAQPKATIPQLKKDVTALKGETAKPLPEISRLAFSQHSVESHSIFTKPIIGSDDSVVAPLIEKLENSDWVKQGLAYLPRDIDEEGIPCPFCQERTITPALVENIAGYFDEAYEADIATLTSLERAYRDAKDGMHGVDAYTSNSFAAEHKPELEKLYSLCIQSLETNLRAIQGKIKNPRNAAKLVDTTPAFGAYNDLVDNVNSKIREYNAKLADREASLKALKNQFWELMRWQYDQTLRRYQQDQKEANDRIEILDRETSEIGKKMDAKSTAIAAAQKQTLNIDEAIENINVGLVGLGIEDFEIKKHSDRLYRVVRSGDTEHAFDTLSEGEKMIISFLYFCELCKGRLGADDAATKRIAVIDDPISSLSHIYIFNVGQLIKSLFFESDRFAQVFVLTHCLYFFYELTDTKHDRRKEKQKLFRMVKSPSGSQILDMKYEEIQNDYQSYWEVVKDDSQPPALIANCMRNIIEYFFNFVKKKDMNSVFQMPELRDTRYQAFCRYINRESHSLGQNIFDLKEFDYDMFKEALRLVFAKTGFSEHYNQMMKH